MSNIVSDLRCFGPGKKGYAPQTVPTVEQLIAAGAEETGYTLADYDGDRDIALAEGRDTRTWVIEKGSENVIYVPDEHGFYLENFNGNKWRPSDLDEAVTLVEEMSFQMNRYGELL